MKEEYPNYKLGEIQAVYKLLNKKEKETLADFLKKCSITAGEKKVEKIKRLILQLRDVIQKPLTELTKNDVDSYLVILSQSKKSCWTKDELKVYIKQFLLWYYKDFTLVENFRAEGKKGLNPQKITENNLISEEEVEMMLRYAESFKEKCYLLLSFQTGARPQELLELRWKDCKFEDKYADITLYSGKTKQSRTFPVVDKTMNALWEWKQHYSFPNVKSQDYVFPSRWRNKSLTTAGANKILRRMATASGLDKDVWNYLFRHSRATKLYEELPQQIVEKLMGHKNMAGIYAHISSKKAREEMLNKIYKIKELTPNHKKEVEELKEQINQLKQFSQEGFKKIIEIILNTSEDNEKFNKLRKKELLILQEESNKELEKFGIVIKPKHL